jgi:hypothetical protein
MIPIRMLSEWTYWLDADGNTTRTLPRGLVLSEEMNVACAAVAAGAAEATRPLSDEEAALVEYFKLCFAGYTADEAAEMLYGGDPQDPASVVPPPTVTAVDESGAETEVPNPGEVTLGHPEAPPAPLAETATKGKGSKKRHAADA